MEKKRKEKKVLVKKNPPTGTNLNSLTGPKENFHLIELLQWLTPAGARTPSGPARRPTGWMIEGHREGLCKLNPSRFGTANGYQIRSCGILWTGEEGVREVGCSVLGGFR
jgi:hypothetical protein